MKKGITFFIKIICSFLLGIVANKMFTTSNIIKVFIFKVVKENPFIYTIKLKEMIYFYFIIAFIFSIIIIIYKDKESKLEIGNFSNFILKIEIIIFSFIVGTQILSKEKINLEYLKNLTSLDILFFLEANLLNFYNYLFTLEYKNIEISEVVYKSREKLLETIKSYLKNMEAFSIIGDWGIGKSILVKNFFFRNKKDYELIFIDSSIYSSNEKIVETLEDEIRKLLKKYNIFVKNKNIEEEIFIQSNNFISTIYNSFFRKTTVEDYRKEIRRKIKFVKQLGKTVVICLDNLERLSSKDRIKNLFAIVDELLPENIKKIYIYDEKEMERLFNTNGNSEEDNKKSNEFINYIEKYTFNKIEVNSTTYEEILENLCEKDSFKYNIITNFIKDFYDKYTKYEIFKKLENKLLNDTLKGCNDKEILVKEIILKIRKKINYIKLGLNNPRYLKNLTEYLEPYIKDENIKYRLEYKIIKDFLIYIDENSLKINNIMECNILNKPNLFFILPEEKIKNLSINDIKIEKIEILCMILSFKLNFDLKENYDNFIRGISYEGFFYNSEEKIFEEEILLKKYEKNPERNLINIMEKIYLLYPDNIIKILTEKINYSGYILKSEIEVNRLLHFPKIEKYYPFIFEKIILLLPEKNKEQIILKYMQDSQDLYYLIKFIKLDLSDEKIQIHTKIEICLKKLEEYRDLFEKIKLFNICQEKLNMLMELLKIKMKTEKNFQIEIIDIRNINGYYDDKKIFLNSIKLDSENLIIENRFEENISISKKYLDDIINKYLNELNEICKKDNNKITTKDELHMSRIRLFLLQVEELKAENNE